MADTQNQPKDETTKRSRGPRTQAGRRMVYGVNVTVALIVAIVLAVLLNLVVHRGYQAATGAMKNWVRYDLTATRRYSMSEQSRRVLEDLDQEFELVGLFKGTNVHLRRLPRLMGQYAANGPTVTTRRIRFDRDIQARQQLLRDLHSRFESDIKPVRAALQRLVKASDDQANGQEPTLKVLSAQLKRVSQPLAGAVQSGELTDARLKTTLREIRRQLKQADPQQRSELKIQAVRDALAKPLPDYGQLKSSFQSRLQTLRDALKQANRLLQDPINADDVPGSVQNRLVRAAEAMKKARQTASQALKPLNGTSVPDEYSQLRSDVMQNESVVILGPDAVRVLAVSDLYRTNTQNRRGRAQQQQQQRSFVGEEKITGALLSMSMDSSPLAVFVSVGRPALGPRGQYSHVADRLRSANFEVTQWNPGSQRRRRGGGSEPPQADEGQQAVWIVTPSGQPRNRRAMMQAFRGKQQVASHLRKRMQAGDSVMMMLSLSRSAGMGSADPMQSLVDAWGIEPQVDRLVLQMRTTPRGRELPRVRHTIEDWSGSLRVTRALGRMEGMFAPTSPIKLKSKSKIEHHPLIRVTGNRLWAETELRSFSSLREVEVDENTRADSFLLGVAAEKNTGGRLIVTTAGSWASNGIAANARLRATRTGQVQRGGLRYPANSELFVNSIYWLTRNDRLIAPSPRTQDIRRVQADMSVSALYWYRGVAVGGLPALALALGVGVWFVRRRG